VDSLLPLFDGDIGELETGIEEFEGKMQVLRTHLEVLDAMDIAGFEKEAAVIRRMATNPKNMDKVKEAIETLAQAIEESREARKPRMPTIYPPQELCRLIESVPKGLPSSLWGRTPGELAEAIAKGPFGNTPNRKVVVRLSRRWYYYEPDEPDILLQPYDGDVELLDMKDATKGK